MFDFLVSAFNFCLFVASLVAYTERNRALEALYRVSTRNKEVLRQTRLAVAHLWGDPARVVFITVRGRTDAMNDERAKEAVRHLLELDQRRRALEKISRNFGSKIRERRRRETLIAQGDE